MSAEELAAGLDQARSEAMHAARLALHHALEFTGADDLCAMRGDVARVADYMLFAMDDMSGAKFADVGEHLRLAGETYGIGLDGSTAQSEVVGPLAVAATAVEQGMADTQALQARMARIRVKLSRLVGDIEEVRRGRAVLSRHFEDAAAGIQKAIDADTNYRMQAGLPMPEGE